jgi:putative cardiolipin synthase
MLALALGACSTPPVQPPAPMSLAWAHPTRSALAQAYPAAWSDPAGRSGFLALFAGQEALAARAALADAAQHTLDLQYYIVRPDATTELLLARVVQAARRGVRVRLLIDDLDAMGQDALFIALARIPGVEVRLFNPFATRGAPGFWHLVEGLARAAQLNRRMHNKLWIADSAMAVTGGRNLGEEYFDAGRELNFADLDLLAAGPVVKHLSDSFDRYWNSPWAVPMQALSLPAHEESSSPAELARQLLDAQGGFRDSAYARQLRDSRFARALKRGELTLVPAAAEVVDDAPDKIDPGGDNGRLDEHPTPSAATVTTRSLFPAAVRARLARARQELILVSPYFVPGGRGVEELGALARRGVRVRVLTNSLASADRLPLVHAGYTRYRDALARAGVELHEMRPDDVDAEGWRRPGRSSGAHLHAKAIVIDREQVLVGSMNLDPRSRLSNTELGLWVNSPVLAQALARRFDEAVAPTRAWRVRWVDDGREVPHLAWEAEENGDRQRLLHEPQAALWRRALSRLFSLIVPEALL